MDWMTMSAPISEPDTLTVPTPETAAPITATTAIAPLIDTSAPPIVTTPPRTIRVLHLVNGEHYSGAERVQDLLAKQLPHFGCYVGFVCVKPRRFPAARESKDALLVEMPMRGRFDLRVVKRIVRMIREERYNLVHAHTPRTALVGGLAARRAGVLVGVHVIDAEDVDHVLGRERRPHAVLHQVVQAILLGQPRQRIADRGGRAPVLAPLRPRRLAHIKHLVDARGLRGGHQYQTKHQPQSSSESHFRPALRFEMRLQQPVGVRRDVN